MLFRVWWLALSLIYVRSVLKLYHKFVANCTMRVIIFWVMIEAILNMHALLPKWNTKMSPKTETLLPQTTRANFRSRELSVKLTHLSDLMSGAIARGNMVQVQQLATQIAHVRHLLGEVSPHTSS